MSFEQRDMQYFFYGGKQWYGVPPTYLLAVTPHMNNVNSELWGGEICLICCFFLQKFYYIYDTTVF